MERPWPWWHHMVSLGRKELSHWSTKSWYVCYLFIAMNYVMCKWKATEWELHVRRSMKDESHNFNYMYVLLHGKKCFQCLTTLNPLSLVATVVLPDRQKWNYTHLETSKPKYRFLQDDGLPTATTRQPPNESATVHIAIYSHWCREFPVWNKVSFNRIYVHVCVLYLCTILH